MVKKSYMGYVTFLLEKLELNSGIDNLGKNSCKISLFKNFWKSYIFRFIRPFLDDRMQQFVRDPQTTLEEADMSTLYSVALVKSQISS